MTYKSEPLKLSVPSHEWRDPRYYYKRTVTFNSDDGSRGPLVDFYISLQPSFWLGSSTRIPTVGSHLGNPEKSRPYFLFSFDVIRICSSCRMSCLSGEPLLSHPLRTKIFGLVPFLSLTCFLLLTSPLQETYTLVNLLPLNLKGT